MGRQIASSIIAEREFAAWRNIWFASTIVAFLSVNFFIYAMILVVICLYARAVRAASASLYIILLFAVPVGNQLIAGAGIVNTLLTLNNPRLLAIFLLLPILFATRGFDRRQLSVCAMPDRLVVGYALLSAALEIRNTEITNVMRVGAYYTLDVLVPYFALSRTVTSLADVRKVFLAFVIAVLPLSLIAVVELAKGWHLYATVQQSWGYEPEYLQREGMERAYASAGGSIALGFIIMVAIGCMLAMWQTVRSPQLKVIVMTAFAVGLFATLSRGPWVGVAILLLVYWAIRPNANGHLFAVIGAVALALVLLVPTKILMDFLPFGSVESQNIEFRQQLFDNAMVVIQRYPWFGTADFRETPEMLALVHGDQIMDIVNTYLEIAMRSGLVGLSLFVGIFTAVLLGLRRMLKIHAVKDADFKTYVRALIATLIAILLTIVTVSSIGQIPYIYWSFAGLGVALTRIGYQERSASVRTVRATRVRV
jgi:O-antigen ligase